MLQGPTRKGGEDLNPGAALGPAVVKGGFPGAEAVLDEAHAGDALRPHRPHLKLSLRAAFPGGGWCTGSFLAKPGVFLSPIQAPLAP